MSNGEDIKKLLDPCPHGKCEGRYLCQECFDALPPHLRFVEAKTNRPVRLIQPITFTPEEQARVKARAEKLYQELFGEETPPNPKE